MIKYLVFLSSAGYNIHVQTKSGFLCAVVQIRPVFPDSVTNRECMQTCMCSYVLCLAISACYVRTYVYTYACRNLMENSLMVNYLLSTISNII